MLRFPLNFLNNKKSRPQSWKIINASKRPPTCLTQISAALRRLRIAKNERVTRAALIAVVAAGDNRNVRMRGAIDRHAVFLPRYVWRRTTGNERVEAGRVAAQGDDRAERLKKMRRLRGAGKTCGGVQLQIQ